MAHFCFANCFMLYKSYGVSHPSEFLPSVLAADFSALTFFLLLGSKSADLKLALAFLFSNALGWRWE